MLLLFINYYYIITQTKFYLKQNYENFINNFINHSKRIIKSKALIELYESQKYNYLKDRANKLKLLNK